MLSEEEKKDKYINKLLNFSDETINNAEKLVINKEQAKEFIEELKRDYIPKAIINLEMENFKKHSELIMLSAEEKKAIERMHDLIHTCEVGIEKHGQYDDLFKKDKQAIDTVLNLITRLEKELKEQMHKKTYARQNVMYKNKQLGQARNKIKKLQKENEEKDKQIDLMAEYIYNMQIECNVYYKDKKQVKQYFENLAKGE